MVLLTLALLTTAAACSMTLRCCSLRMYRGRVRVGVWVRVGVRGGVRLRLRLRANLHQPDDLGEGDAHLVRVRG